MQGAPSIALPGQLQSLRESFCSHTWAAGWYTLWTHSSVLVVCRLACITSNFRGRGLSRPIGHPHTCFNRMQAHQYAMRSLAAPMVLPPLPLWSCSVGSSSSSSSSSCPICAATTVASSASKGACWLLLSLSQRRRHLMGSHKCEGGIQFNMCQLTSPNRESAHTEYTRTTSSCPGHMQSARARTRQGVCNTG